MSILDAAGGKKNNSHDPDFCSKLKFPASFFHLFFVDQNAGNRGLESCSKMFFPLTLKNTAEYGRFCNFFQRIDNTQDRKIREISDPFHEQNRSISKCIFRFWMHERQKSISIHIFISFASKNLTVLTVKVRETDLNLFAFFDVGCCLFDGVQKQAKRGRH